jgi:hypothetical protein
MAKAALQSVDTRNQDLRTRPMPAPSRAQRAVTIPALNLDGSPPVPAISRWATLRAKKRGSARLEGLTSRLDVDSSKTSH